MFVRGILSFRLSELNKETSLPRRIDDIFTLIMITGLFFFQGTCEIYPKIGYALNTSFRINCSDWMDPDQPLTYEFAYVNYYQDNVFFMSHEPTSSSVLLPMGHESNNFTLEMRLKIIDRLGAATVRPITIQVRCHNNRLK